VNSFYERNGGKRVRVPLARNLPRMYVQPVTTRVELMPRIVGHAQVCVVISLPDGIRQGVGWHASSGVSRGVVIEFDVPHGHTCWMLFPDDLEVIGDRGALVSRQEMSAFPHSCPRCSAPAYVGFVSIDCSAGCAP
jgi:hypothetical protein